MPEPTAPAVEEQAPAVEPAATEQTAEQPPAGETAAPALVIGDADQDGDDDDTDETADAGDPELVAALRAAGVTVDLRQAAAIGAEIERRAELRRTIDTRVETLRTRGVLVPKVAEHAEALLRHADETVREHAWAVLDQARPPVAVGAALGHNASTSATTSDDPDAVALAELSEHEDDRRAFGRAWGALSTEQRKDAAFRAVYDRVMNTPKA